MIKKYRKSNEIKQCIINDYTKLSSYIDKNNNEIHKIVNKYDFYIFMRIDCVFSKKIDLSKYYNQLDDNIIKKLCNSDSNPKRFDHDRDWDFGLVSKNIDNMYKYINSDFEVLNPSYYE